MFSYPINSNCCSSCVSLRKRFYIPPSQWIVIEGTFSRTVGYNHIVSSGTTVPSVSHHIVSSDRVSRPGMGILCSNILSRATGVSICRDSAGIYIFQNMSWGWEMRVRRYDQVLPRVKQHLFKLSFCRFSIMCHYHISPHPACYAAIWSKSGFYWFIKVLQVLYGINITTSHHFIVCFKWHRGVHALVGKGWKHMNCMSKVKSWKLKVKSWSAMLSWNQFWQQAFILSPPKPKLMQLDPYYILPPEWKQWKRLSWNVGIDLIEIKILCNPTHVESTVWTPVDYLFQLSRSFQQYLNQMRSGYQYLIRKNIWPVSDIRMSWTICINPPSITSQSV